jgi:hypothetical protein
MGQSDSKVPTSARKTKTIPTTSRTDTHNMYQPSLAPPTPGATKSQPTSVKLDQQEVGIYRTIRNVVKARTAAGRGPRHVLVISDLGKDYDDLTAFILLKELHRLGAIVLEGVVANLKPTHERARFGRGALDQLGLNNVPIAQGTVATDDETEEVKKYEFEEAEKMFMAGKDSRFEEGQAFIKKICEKAEKKKFKLSLLLISGLRDINAFAGTNPSLFKKVVQDITLQGGYIVQGGHIIPSDQAANNKYDMEAAIKFHQFIETNQIPSIVFTKIATFALKIKSSWFEELEKTGHKLGGHLRYVQLEQEKEFYSRACSPTPYRPFMTKSWYLDYKTTWWDHHDKSKGEEPKTEDLDEVVPYLNKVIIYDALAALGVAGDDVLNALDVLDLPPQQRGTRHRYVGEEAVITNKIETKAAVEGVKGDNFTIALKALVMGSLLACQKGLAV